MLGWADAYIRRSIVNTYNAGETQNAQRTRPSPPLSVDELITLATAPELKLYP